MKIGNKDTLRENKCIFFRYLNNRRERIEHSISLRSKQKLNHSKYLFYEKFKFTNNFNALQSPPPSLINLKTSNRNTSVSNCKKNPLDKNHLSTHLKTETISNVHLEPRVSLLFLPPRRHHRSTSYSPLLLILLVNNNHVKTTIPAARLKSVAEIREARCNGCSSLPPPRDIAQDFFTRIRGVFGDRPR